MVFFVNYPLLTSIFLWDPYYSESKSGGLHLLLPFLLCMWIRVLWVFALKPVWIEVFPLQHLLHFNCVCICVCVHVEARGQPRVLFLRSLAPCFLRHSASLAWGSLIWLGCLASEPQGSSCLPPLALEVLVTTSGFFKSIFLFFCQFHTCIYWIKVILPH